jgi:hypothetical protein
MPQAPCHLDFAIMDNTTGIPADLSCHRCGYDLRAHALEGKCPECGEPVAASRQLAALPRRPAWRDSDPRWRRRMLAGMWILVLLPLMDVLKVTGWAERLPVPTVFDLRGPLVLNDTFLCGMGLYRPLAFCIGVVLLFSKESGRRRGRLDWTRRWGIICSYVVLLLSVAQVVLITAFVLAGIAALCLSLPLKNQPAMTQWFVNVSAACLRYGPHSKDISMVVLAVFSSIAILLACTTLFDALRSSGPKWVAATLLAPLALFALVHLSQAGAESFTPPGGLFSPPREVDELGAYFRPRLLVRLAFRGPLDWPLSQWGLSPFVIEAAKWCIVLTIAVWLSIAQIAARRRRSPTIWSDASAHKAGRSQHSEALTPPSAR